MPELWPFPDKDPVLQTNEVHVWRANLLNFETQVAFLQKLLSNEEIERAKRFHFPKHRFFFIAARAILRSILSFYSKISPELLSFSYDSYGKPKLINNDQNELFFNVSHSHHFAIYALTLQHEVGIDIEQVRSDLDYLSLAQQFFAKNEILTLSSLDADQQIIAFFRCWTQKEAYVKGRGMGLSLPLQDFEVSVDPKQTTFIPIAGQSESWSVTQLYPFPNTIAAVAAIGNPRVRCWSSPSIANI